MKTYGRGILLLCAHLLVVGGAQADFLYVFPREQLRIQLQFRGLENQFAYDFYVKWEAEGWVDFERVGPPHQSFQFASVGARRSVPQLSSVVLFAVPRGWTPPEREEYIKPGWMTARLPGSFQSTHFDGPDGPLSEAHNHWKLTYRVRMDSDKLIVDLINSEPPPSSQVPGWMVCVGIVMSTFAVLAIFLIRLVKRADRQVA